MATTSQMRMWSSRSTPLTTGANLGAVPERTAAGILAKSLQWWEEARAGMGEPCVCTRDEMCLMGTACAREMRIYIYVYVYA